MGSCSSCVHLVCGLGGHEFIASQRSGAIYQLLPNRQCTHRHQIINGKSACVGRLSFFQQAQFPVLRHLVHEIVDQPTKSLAVRGIVRGERRLQSLSSRDASRTHQAPARRLPTLHQSLVGIVVSLFKRQPVDSPSLLNCELILQRSCRRYPDRPNYCRKYPQSCRFVALNDQIILNAGLGLSKYPQQLSFHGLLRINGILLDCYALRKISRLVDVAASPDGNVVGEELEGDDFEDGE